MTLPKSILADAPTLALLVQSKLTGTLPNTSYDDAWDALEAPQDYAPSNEVETWMRENWNSILFGAPPAVVEDEVMQVIPHTPARAWFPTFLEKFAERGIVTVAAAGCGITPKTVYANIKSNPQFAADFEEAGKMAADKLEDAAWQRAVEGVYEPIVGRVGKDQDGVVADMRRYSDTLTLSLLKARRPEKFREKAGDTNVNVNASAQAASSTSVSVSKEDIAARQLRTKKKLAHVVDRAKASPALLTGKKD